METLKFREFKDQLKANADSILQFKYGKDKFVDASYHITEIKQAPITSVDCGGVVNNWTEIIIQLWEPENKTNEKAMQVAKALSIINMVEKALPLNADAVIKIEFGNSKFDTRQMLPQAFVIDNENLVIELGTDTVQCKATGRGDSCGTVELKNLAIPAGCCEPASGCC